MLKNDKERKAFLDTRSRASGWYLWKEDPDLQREWWRFDLPDCALIVEQQEITYNYPEWHRAKNILHWYIIRDWHGLFADQVASKTQVLQEVRNAAAMDLCQH